MPSSITKMNGSGLKTLEQTGVILKLRAQGMSVHDIAAELGIAYGTVYRRMKDIAEERASEGLAEYRAVQNDQLDQLTEKYMPAALRGDDKAAHFMLKVLERRAKLNGMDLNPTININTIIETTPQESELAALIHAAEEKNRIVEGELAAS